MNILKYYINTKHMYNIVKILLEFYKIKLLLTIIIILYK
jgi:hypothetical protein